MGNYNVRSESIVKYDAKDASGNNAEQVVFAVILEDHTAPKISLAYYPKKLEAIGNKKCTWNKYPKSTVADNIDFNIKATNNCKTINLHQLGTTQCSYQAHLRQVLWQERQEQLGHQADRQDHRP